MQNSFSTQGSALKMEEHCSIETLVPKVSQHRPPLFPRYKSVPTNLEHIQT
jgi:hypothetical protein